MLFDTGSPRSFISAEDVVRKGLQLVRKEKLGISAFGSMGVEVKVRDVIELTLIGMRGKKKVSLHCYAVDEISYISNVYPEVVREAYPHLHEIWFSAVSRHQKRLKVDILIGVDYLWRFQESEVRRTEPNEPVTIKTSLGWVFSGLLEDKTFNSITSININFLPMSIFPAR